MSVRVVIDTNVLVSSFLSRNPASPTVRIVDAVVDGRLMPVHSRDIMDEYRDVLGRGCLGIDPVRVDALVGRIAEVGLEVAPSDSDWDFPDPDDKVFHCTALAAGAYLVTGNARHFPVSDFTVSPAQFCELSGI